MSRARRPTCTVTYPLGTSIFTASAKSLMHQTVDGHILTGQQSAVFLPRLRLAGRGLREVTQFNPLLEDWYYDLGIPLYSVQSSSYRRWWVLLDPIVPHHQTFAVPITPRRGTGGHEVNKV